jgi:hypothetical protein
MNRTPLPPISSFDISLLSKHHSPIQADPTRRRSHLRAHIWIEAQVGATTHNEFDDIQYRADAGHLSSDSPRRYT